MDFNRHSDLAGAHAFLSPSKYHWINYDHDKLVETFRNSEAAVRGTRLHNFAREAIELGIKLPRSPKTLNMYVNDAIGYRMTPEQPLMYSYNAFGTADAISFRNDMLRIHDLKTGVSPVSMKQLEIYVALFCLEYKKDPRKIGCEVRIYKEDEVLLHEPIIDDILFIMDRIVEFDKIIEHLKEER